MSTIGSRVRSLRVSQQLTQVDLSARLGIKQNTLSDIERDKNGSMTAFTLEAICRVLVTTPKFVLYGVDGGTTHEAVMQEAELSALFRELPPSAQSALLNNARMLREAIPTPSAASPFPETAVKAPQTKSK
jgi:transcriptional regulator with XRE-family HTH domain